MKTAAVIGAGYISRYHIRAIQALPQVTLGGVCDLSPAVAESVSEQFGIERWYTNHLQMLDDLSPDVVHVTTPIASHVPLACDALDRGAHVLVEKPITATRDDWNDLRRRADSVDRWVVEDHNYLFNRPVRELRTLMEDGRFGDVMHVDITFCLDLSGSVFADPNIRHEALDLPGGAIHDFLPHMAYLALAFIGRQRSVSTSWRKVDDHSPLPHDEFRALVNGERATATLGFSSHSQPDGFWITAYGTQMQARINLLEDRITTTRVRGGPPPLMHLFNGLQEGRQTRRSARRSLSRKLSGGPASYEGLFELVRCLYQSLSEDAEPPVTADQVDQTQQLVHALTATENRL